MGLAQIVTRAVTNLILPVNCLRCGIESDWVCPSCRQDIILTRPEQCVICHKVGSNWGLCSRCRKYLDVEGVVSPFRYHDEIIRELIHQAKYNGHYDALRFLLKNYRRELISSLMPGSWQLTPIPLSKKRLSERGFNQAELIARELGQGQWPIVTALIKTRETVSQTGLVKKERAVNVRNSFLPNTVKLGGEIIVVDDVITTGSTIKEAVRSLRRRHKIKRVWVITLAHG